MTKKPRRPATEDSSPITVLRGIQQGSLSPKSLPRETRLTCVEHLTGEGYTASEIAEILEISTRTAFRDLGRIREANALERDPQVVKEMVGQAVLHARLAVARLRRIGRDRSTHASAQVEAELGAWRVTKELTELLQRLGILPLAAQEIRADLTHHAQEVPTAGELRQNFDKLKSAWDAAGAPAEFGDAFAGVDALLAKAEASEVVGQLQATLPVSLMNEAEEERDE
jgi:transposase